MTAPPTRAIDLRIHDTTIGIWQESANDPSFEKQIFHGLLQHLRKTGWRVTHDADVRARHRCLDPYYRRCLKGELHASVHICGRCIEMNVWAETWPKQNRNGHRHDFGKRERMDYLTRLRFDLTVRRLTTWLGKRATLTLSNANLDRRGPHFGGITTVDYIAKRYAESSHTDKALGHPICRYDYNCRSADGARVEHGRTIWFLDRKGRVLRGTAYYNINNMWWVVAGPFDLHNLACHEIYCTMPPAPRIKRRDNRLRRQRLEAELARATARMQFDRAATLRKILFGDEPLYRIFSKKHDAYYRALACGYAADIAGAGLYTFDEAVAHVRHAPDVLRAMTIDGRQLSADELSMEAA